MIKDFEIKGEWKLPEQNEYVSGTLYFSQLEGGKLELFNQIEQKIIGLETKIIIGKTSEGYVTLLHNRYRQSSENHITETRHAIYQPSKILIGKTYFNLEDIAFKKVHFSLFNLLDWVNISGIKDKLRGDLKNVEITYTRPEEIEFEFNEDCSGNISFDLQFSEYDYPNSYSFKQGCFIGFKYNYFKSYEEIIKDISIFQGFITFAICEQTYPLFIRFEDDSIPKHYSYGNQVSCYYKTPYFDSTKKIRFQPQQLFTFKDIQFNLSGILKEWYRNFNEIEPVSLLLLSLFTEKYKWSSEKFLKVVRALETYDLHTRHTSHLQLNPLLEKIKRIKDFITNSEGLKKEDKKWLKSQLAKLEKQFAYPSLQERLKYLLQISSSNYLKKKITDVEIFTNSSVNSRNYYTHLDPKLKDKALKGEDLYKNYQPLFCLLICCICAKIGINNNLIDSKFENQII